MNIYFFTLARTEGNSVMIAYEFLDNEQKNHEYRHQKQGIQS